MTMVARFEKDDMKISDGFDKKRGFQMVPALGGDCSKLLPVALHDRRHRQPCLQTDR
jgi:hypothetical protein